MGKRIWVQRKGSGFPHEQTPSHRRQGEVKYRKFPKTAPPTTAVVKDLLHDAGRGAPIAQIQFEDGKKWLYLVPEGVFVGDTIQFADSGEIKVGNVFKLENVPDGSYVFNIEQEPNDGGRYIRGSGTYGTVISRDNRFVEVLLPSGKKRKFLKECRCTIGIVAAGGRVNKPFLKAGARRYWMMNKHTIWPKVKGNKMPACDHPFGGGRHRSPHKPTTTARNTPPGRKVGLIAARRTGRG